MLRKIPSTMATQHPDNASAPYWHTSPLVMTHDETYEAYLNFSDLGIDEYKWDWEGKLVDESVAERLFSKYLDYFTENQLGEDKFLTYRIPNPTQEGEFRLGRAFMGMLSAANIAKAAGVHTPPLFEVILPMAETAKLMIDIQEAFRELAGLKHWLFNTQRTNLEHIQIIPLFEQVDIIAYSDRILAEYLKMHEEKFGFTPTYMRPYVARSDPSLNSGHPATVLAIKIAFSRYADLEQKTGVQLYPIIGCAALPFRGGLTPNNVRQFVQEYEGVKSLIIQSAFRYDYTKEEAVKGIRDIQELLPNSKPRKISREDQLELLNMIGIFQSFYQASIQNIAPLVNQIAEFFPKRRERVQHTGLFGYSRGVGKVKLPRAIKFTGSLYSVGLPPELIGVGRALRQIQKMGKLSKLQEFYLNLQSDYERVGSFLNKDNLQKLAKTEVAWQEVWEDVQEIENILGLELKPQTEAEKEHCRLAGEILDLLQSGQTKNLEELITQTGVLRKSLG